MNIYQKKIVKENETIFLEDFVQQMKNNNKNSKPMTNIELPQNLNIRKYYGINSKLLKKSESVKNNRQYQSKSQIFSSSPFMDNLIPPEIKTIIIKLGNPKEQKNSKEKNKTNDKINNEKNDKNDKNINNNKNNNDFNTNYTSLICPSPEKKHTRNKSLILNNKNENSCINISVNTIYKKSYCLDKQNKIKGNKERATTAPKTKLNPDKKGTKINKKLIKNVSSPNILNTIEIASMPKNKEKNNNKKYVSTNIYQNININNNINNLNVVQYDLSISPDIKNNSKISEILTSRNDKNRSDKIKNFNVFESMDNSFLNKYNSKKSKNVSKFNDIIDKMNNIFSSRHSKFNLYNNKFINTNNRNQFLLNKINAMKIFTKDKENILKTNNNINQNDFLNKCKVDYIYKNKNKNKMEHKNKDKIANDNINNIKDENTDYDINIKNNNINKTNKIKSIPLKLNNSCLFGIVSSK